MKTPESNARNSTNSSISWQLLFSRPISAADSWQAIETFGQAKLEWLKQFLDLPNEIPSHDTFARVFARLDPQQLQQCLGKWMESLAASLEGQGKRH